MPIKKQTNGNLKTSYNFLSISRALIPDTISLPLDYSFHTELKVEAKLTQFFKQGPTSGLLLSKFGKDNVKRHVHGKGNYRRYSIN